MLSARALRATQVGSRSLYKFLLLIMQREALRPCIAVSRRAFASSAEKDLKSTLRDVIPGKRELLKKVKSHGNKVIGEVKIENAIGGMRWLQLSYIYMLIL